MFSLRTFWSLSILALFSLPSEAASPLHDQIDKLIESHPSFDVSAAEIADDASFLRRVSLDLSGSIPGVQQVREFLDDDTNGKRRKLIDKLLASPEHARQMQFVFDEMLMERKAGKHIKSEAWQEYLRQAFLANKPWDKLVQELLSADGADEQTRPAAKFLLSRELRMDDVTRDMGRIFLGRDLQCAQCHDHPSVSDYHQHHYYGLMAFLKRSYLFKDPKSGLTSIGEKAEGDVEFTSAFTSETDRTAPRMLNLPPLDDPPSEEEPYKVKRSKTTRSIPTYSRRAQLAVAMTDEANEAFRLNIANRLWALMMGQGLVEPLDMMHGDNPASHPKVLQLLADSLLEHEYDLRFLLRELALTRTYQRSSRGNAASENHGDYSIAQIKPLSPEQLVLSMMKATGVLNAPPAPSPKKMAQQDAAIRKSVAPFIKLFAEGGQSTRFDAAAEQALFLRNDGLLQSWIATKEGLVDKLQTQEEEKEVAQEFYLAVYSRLPAPDEIQFVTEYLQSKSNRRDALLQLTWAALVSVEFRFNH